MYSVNAQPVWKTQTYLYFDIWLISASSVCLSRHAFTTSFVWQYCYYELFLGSKQTQTQTHFFKLIVSLGAPRNAYVCSLCSEKMSLMVCTIQWRFKAADARGVMSYDTKMHGVIVFSAKTPIFVDAQKVETKMKLTGRKVISKKWPPFDISRTLQ